MDAMKTAVIWSSECFYCATPC